MRSARLTLLAILAGWLLAALMPLHAAEGGFTATLSTDQQTAAGLAALTVVERAALDRLVAQEVALAREQGIAEFSGPFVARLADDDRKAAGLDRLTPAQLTRLNELVAAAIAARPKPKERPRLKESEVLAAAREQNRIHGSITVAYGWGGGGTFRGESLWLDYYDPESRVGIGLGLSNFDGSGYYGGYPDYYDYGPRYSGTMPAYYDSSFRGAPQEDFVRGEGQSFSRGGGGWGGRGGHRGH